MSFKFDFRKNSKEKKFVQDHFLGKLFKKEIKLFSTTHMKETTKILVVDDEATICEVLSDCLNDKGYEVKSEQNGFQAFERLKNFKPHIVLLDIWMPQSEMDGMEFLKKAKEKYPEIEIIMMSGHGNIETAVKATKLGALDFVEKPLSIDKIFILIKNCLALQKEKKEKLTLLNRLRENIAMIGVSQSIQSLRKKIADLSLNQSYVLIQGEIGTGKRLIAQNIHYLSHRRHEAFVEVNSTKVPKSLIDIELFGCKENTFKASPESKKGKCDYAESGTLFLNEITALDFKTQEKILNLIEKQNFTRVNDTLPTETNIKVIASTQKDMKTLSQGKVLISSLFEKFKKNLIQTSPLRERKEDLLPLMNHFGENFNRKSNYLNKKFKEEDIVQLKNHSWPGNLNELKNLVERTFILPSESLNQPFLFQASKQVPSQNLKDIHSP